jgi:hypothetical protein
MVTHLYGYRRELSDTGNRTRSIDYLYRVVQQASLT